MERADKLATAGGLHKRKGQVQTLTYANDWTNGEYKLLELPTKLVEVLKVGDRLTVRGDDDDEAVLCTNKETYSLKFADTSNALLLVPDLSTNKSPDFGEDTSLVKREVVASFDTAFEIKPVRAKLERLKHALDACAYRGRDKDGDDLPSTTTSDLLDVIQASEGELMTALKKLGAIKIDGNWRCLDLSYQEKAFAQVLAVVEEKCWTCDLIPLSECCDVLDELYPRFIIEHCLQVYGTQVNDSDGNLVAPTSYCITEDRVCSFYAEYILRPAGKFNYHEFLEAWKQSVPEGMECKDSHLLGIALKDEKSHPPVIWHFTDRELSEDPAERFNTLFKEQAKWKRPELEPYLSSLLTPGQAVNSLLLKFARCSTNASGEKVYSTKRPLR